MKINVLAVIAFVACMAFIACDDTTDSIGTSITDNKDLLNVTSASFPVKSGSVAAGTVYARNTTGYVGKVRDPETGSYITGNFMTQFHTFENYEFPSRDSLVFVQNGDTLIGKDAPIHADSCTVGLYYTEFYGDSLANMTLTMNELGEPMQEGVKYYSDFDPMTLVRKDGKGISKSKTYALTDLSVSEDDRTDDSYMASIALKLNDPYTDQNGKTYNNYGTYVMTKYYENPENFKNSYNFIHNVCPGFYFKNKAGLGSMAYITVSQLNVYFKFRNDSTYVGVANFSGTEEVLQATNIENKNIDNLVNDNSCTYVKSPAGIYTELELPVLDILKGHENDTLNTAKIVLTKMNNKTDSEYAFDSPATLLMLPKDSLHNFFENEQLRDNKISFLATDSKSNSSGDYGTYTFNNIAGLITYMANVREKGLATDPDWEAKHPDWNKALVVPVSTTIITQNNTSVLVKLTHDMSLSSVRLVKGDGTEDKIKISVIYSNFNHE